MTLDVKIGPRLGADRVVVVEDVVPDVEVIEDMAPDVCVAGIREVVVLSELVIETDEGVRPMVLEVVTVSCLESIDCGMAGVAVAINVVVVIVAVIVEPKDV